MLIFLILPMAFALQTTLKSSYQPGQTLIAEISGNFIDNLQAKDVLFYSGRLFSPLVYDLAKINDKYYLYALLPNIEKNYTLIIKNAHYMEAGQEKLQDLFFNFSVQGNLSSFSVNPGFIITDKDFSIKVQANSDLILSSEFLNSSEEFSLNEGKTKTLYFSEPVNSTTNLVLSSSGMKYEVPVFVLKTSNKTTARNELRFSKSNFNFNVIKDHSSIFDIFIFNAGQEALNVSLSSSLPEVKIQPEILSLQAGEIEKINLTIESGDEKIVNGTLTAVSGNITAQASFSITTLSNQGELNTTQDIEESSDSCSSLSGKICNSDEKCDTSTILTSEGFCCTGTCRKTSSWSSGRIIALVLVILVLLIVGFFIYRKMKMKKINSEDILKAREKAYEERFKSKETRDSLTRE